MDTLVQLLHVGPLAVTLILLAVSVLYFRAYQDQPRLRRILLSSHGVILLSQMTPVVVRDFAPAVHGAWLGYVLWGSLILGLVAIAYSMSAPGRRRVFHSLHIVTILYAALANVYGYQAIITGA